MVLEAIRLLRRELKVPLIGFAGAPFTLASYAIEGGRSSSYALAKSLMYREPQTWHRFAVAPRRGRPRLPPRADRGGGAGGAGVRLVGGRPRRRRLPRVRPAPRAHDLRGAARHGRAEHPLRHRHQPPAAPAPRGGRRRDRPRLAHSLSTRAGRSWARAWPCRATSTPPCSSHPASGCSQGVDDVLRRAGGRPGHVFNLGHGILPGTPVENVKAVVDRVQAARRSPLPEPSPTVAIVGGGIAGLCAAHELHRARPALRAPRGRGPPRGRDPHRARGRLPHRGRPRQPARPRSPKAWPCCATLGLEGRLQPTNPRQRAVYVLRRGPPRPPARGHDPHRPHPALARPREPPLLLAGQAAHGPGPRPPRAGATRPTSRSPPSCAGAWAARPWSGWRSRSSRASTPAIPSSCRSAPPSRASCALEERHGSLIRGLRAAPPAQPSSIPSAFVSLQGGLGELVDALVARLPADSLRTGCRVTGIARATSPAGRFALRLEGQKAVPADAIVVALPPRAAAPLVAPLAEDAAGGPGRDPLRLDRRPRPGLPARGRGAIPSTATASSCRGPRACAPRP